MRLPLRDEANSPRLDFARSPFDIVKPEPGALCSSTPLISSSMVLATASSALSEVFLVTCMKDDIMLTAIRIQRRRLVRRTEQAIQHERQGMNSDEPPDERVINRERFQGGYPP